MEDTAVAVYANGQGIAVAGKDDVVIESHGPAPGGKVINAAVKIGQCEGPATIPPEMLQRYDTWKATPTAPAHPPPSTDSATPPQSV